MSTGTVSFLSGQAVAIAADGTERLLAVGDAILLGDLIRTASGSRLEFTTDNGQVVTLEGGQNWLVSESALVPVQAPAENTVSAEIAAIQEAILAGEDPTELLEATAAGAPGAGAEGNEGADFIVLARTAAEVTPVAGYDTIGLNYSVEQPDGEEGILTGDTIPVISPENPEVPGTPPTPEAPEDPELPEDPEDPEDPESLIADYQGYVGGQGSANNPNGTGGTYADANGLKDTGADNAWAIYNEETGYYSVERQGNPHQESPDQLDPTEAIAFELTNPMTEIWFHFDGNVGGSQWSIYDTNGDRIQLANNERYFSVEDQIDTETGMGHFYLNDSNGEPLEFKYIAFDGGDDSSYSLKPMSSADIGSGELSMSGEPVLMATLDDAMPELDDEVEVGLDLSDLLEGASGDSLDTLVNYIHVAEEGGNLLLSLNHAGEGIDAGIDQVMTIENMTFSDLGLDVGTDQAELLAALLENGVIHVD